MSDLTCVWNMGSECGGDVVTKQMFDKQLEMPICEKHFEEHTDFMFLHACGRDVEDLLKLSAEEKAEMAKQERIKHPDLDFNV